jgi:hypothetical protein
MKFAKMMRIIKCMWFIFPLVLLLPCFDFPINAAWYSWNSISAGRSTASELIIINYEAVERPNYNLKDLHPNH